MVTQSTAAQQLAAIHLGEDPGRWINQRRNTDPVTSWRVIAFELAKATDGALIPSEPTIRKWHKQWVERQLVARLAAEVAS